MASVGLAARSLFTSCDANCETTIRLRTDTRGGLFVLYDVCVNVCTLQTIDSAAETNLVLMAFRSDIHLEESPQQVFEKGGRVKKQKNLKGDWTEPLSHSRISIRFGFFTAS